jgi:hypothetical protein
MPNKKPNKEEKVAELKKYRDLVIATFDYYIEIHSVNNKPGDVAWDEFFKQRKENYLLLKKQTEEHFQKGRLTKLKQWFRDLTEMQIECRDLKFNKYLNEKTNYGIDIFTSYYERVDKVIAKGKITTDNQFYDLKIMIDQLCQSEPVDHVKIAAIDKLLFEYEQRKS